MENNFKIPKFLEKYVEIYRQREKETNGINESICDIDECSENQKITQ